MYPRLEGPKFEGSIRSVVRDCIQSKRRNCHRSERKGNPNGAPPKRGRPVKPDSLRNRLAMRRGQLHPPLPPSTQDEEDSEEGNDSEDEEMD